MIPFSLNVSPLQTEEEEKNPLKNFKKKKHRDPETNNPISCAVGLLHYTVHCVPPAMCRVQSTEYRVQNTEYSHPGQRWLLQMINDNCIKQPYKMYNLGACHP